jgi:hypothetical protein
LVSPQVEVEVEYVPEKPELDDALLADFKDIFDKFTFKDSTADTEVPPYPALTIFFLKKNSQVKGLEAAPCTGLVILAALARILSVGFLFC